MGFDRENAVVVIRPQALRSARDDRIAKSFWVAQPPGVMPYHPHTEHLLPLGHFLHKFLGHDLARVKFHRAENTATRQFHQFG
jgi:hypothetical protein